MGFLDNTGLERLWMHIISKLGEKVNKEDGKGLSANDYTTEEKTKLANLSSVAVSGSYNDLTNKPEIPSIEGLATELYVDNAVTNKVDTAVANLVNSAPETLDTLGEIATALQENEEVVDALNSAIGSKVDKIEGKGLSTNDYTTEEKEKLANLATVAHTGSWDDLEDRPFYESNETITLFETSLTTTSDITKAGNFNSTINNGQTYIVTYNETVYEIVATGNYLGDRTPFYVDDISGGYEYPFFISESFGVHFYGTGEHTIKVETANYYIKQLDKKFIPSDELDISWNNLKDRPFGDEPGFVLYSEVTINAANTKQSLGGNGTENEVLPGPYKVVYNNYTEYEFTSLPCGDANLVEYPFYIEYDSQYVFGTDYYSYYVTAASANDTVALYSPGIVTKQIDEKFIPGGLVQSGTGYYAEVFNGNYAENASGARSHAEGMWTKALNDGAHSEGSFTEASGMYSHAEGEGTVASGQRSHAEGLYTIAASGSQHVQGKYNIEDNSSKYAHIIGNGYGASNRSNAHTLDWSGNAWYAGVVKIGGVGQDDESAKELATQDYVTNAIAAIPAPDVSGQIEVHNTSETAHEDIRAAIYAARDGIVLKDQVNGYNYVLCMRDGELVTYCATESIEVTTMPTKTSYMVGDVFDPTGMVVTATAYNGVAKEVSDVTTSTEPLAETTKEVEVSYTEAGIVHSTDVPISIREFDPAIDLVDFEYTDNGDGTYTLTAWKGTYQGEPSTELIIPNSSAIIV